MGDREESKIISEIKTQFWYLVHPWREIRSFGRKFKCQSDKVSRACILMRAYYQLIMPTRWKVKRPIRKNWGKFPSFSWERVERSTYSFHQFYNTLQNFENIHRHQPVFQIRASARNPVGQITLLNHSAGEKHDWYGWNCPQFVLPQFFNGSFGDICQRGLQLFVADNRQHAFQHSNR